MVGDCNATAIDKIIDPEGVRRFAEGRRQRVKNAA
jgi:hypothetical protein